MYPTSHFSEDLAQTRFLPYPKLLTHYLGLYDLNRK